MSYKLYPIALFFLFISSFSMGQSINQRQEDSITNAWHKRILNKPLAAFVASGDDGVISNDSLKGKVTYINIWEASCAPCMAEMEALNKLYDTLKDNNSFQFISISSDDAETIRRIKKQYNIQYNVFHLSEEGIYGLNDGMGFPTAIITDAKGNAVYSHAGGYTDSSRIWRFTFVTDIYPFLIKQLQ